MAKAAKKSRKKLYIFGGLGIIVVALIILVITMGNKEIIVMVQTDNVMVKTITETVTATGKIQPELKVIITPEVTGEVIELPVKEGDQVTKGQMLLRIKAETYLSQKQRAEATLQSARATLTMKQAEFSKTTSDYNRVKELHSKSLTSDSDLEAAKSNYLSLEAQVESATANVNQSEASVREANEQLNKTIILSPENGIVTKLNIERGERVLGSGFSQGTNIMTVSNLSQMEAIVDVDENDVVHLTLGDTARIKVDAFGDKIFRGIVSQIGNSAKTAATGTQEQVINFEVKIRVIDVNKELKPGMSCNVSIETETKENVLCVPIQAVTARNVKSKETVSEPGVPQKKESVKETKSGGKVNEIVFVIAGNKAKSVNVKTGISDDNYIEIKEGLTAKDSIISGNYRAVSKDLDDGSLVKVEPKKGTEQPKTDKK